MKNKQKLPIIKLKELYAMEFPKPEKCKKCNEPIKKTDGRCVYCLEQWPRPKNI